MDLEKPPIPLDQVVSYLSRNEWQFQLLEEGYPVTVSAMIVRSCLVYLGYVKGYLDEQAERRKHTDVPQAAIGTGQAGHPTSPFTSDGVGPGGTTSGYEAQQRAGEAEWVDGGGLGKVDVSGISPGSVSSGSRRPAGEADDPEDNGRDRRAGGETHEGGLTTEREFNAPTSEISFQGKECDSVGNLVTFAEFLFDCRQGQFSSRTYHNDEQIAYVTLGFITPAPRQKTDTLQNVSDGNATQLLRQTMMSTLMEIQRRVGGKPRLYWRYAPERRFDEEIHIEGRSRSAKLMTRIAVPGVNWDKIHGYKQEGEQYVRV